MGTATILKDQTPSMRKRKDTIRRMRQYEKDQKVQENEITVAGYPVQQQDLQYHGMAYRPASF